MDLPCRSHVQRVLITIKIIIAIPIIIFVLVGVLTTCLLQWEKRLLSANDGPVRRRRHNLGVALHEVPVTHCLLQEFTAARLIDFLAEVVASIESGLGSRDLLIPQVLLEVATLHQVIVVVGLQIKGPHLMLPEAVLHGLDDVFQATEGLDHVHAHLLVLLDRSVVRGLGRRGRLRLLLLRKLVD